MKKILFSIVVSLFMITCISSVNAINFGIEITGSNYVDIGKTITLKAEQVTYNDLCPPNDEDCQYGEVGREDYTNKVSWKSSNPSIATVNSTGVVTGIKEGSVEITADDSNGTDPDNKPFIVYVHRNKGPNIRGSRYIELNATEKYKAYYPNSCMGEEGENCAEEIVDVTNKSTWTSSDPSIIQIVSNGNLKGLKEGTTTITITYTGSNGFKGTTVIELNVHNPNEEDDYIEEGFFSYTLNGEEKEQQETLTIEKGQKLQLKYTGTLPSECKDNPVEQIWTPDEKRVQILAGTCLGITDLTNKATWNSTDANIVSVSNGLIQGLKNGSTTITAYYKSAVGEISKGTLTVKVVENTKEVKKNNKVVKKYKTHLVPKTPDTASPASIIAIVMSIALFIFVGFNLLQKYSLIPIFKDKIKK